MLRFKQKCFSSTLSVLLCAIFSFAVTTTCSAAIVIGGTGNALGTMKKLADAYQNATPGVKVKVLPSIGSGGAIKSVTSGRVQIGLSARPLKPAEAKKGIVAIEYARTPTIFAVANKTKVTAVTLAQLVDIYNGVLKQWPDGSTIRPILRQAKDDNTRQIKALSPEMKKAVTSAEHRKGFLFAATDQKTVDKIESIPGSFGVTSLALMLSENRKLHALTLDGIKPTVESCKSGDYPMTKRFYFILPRERSAQVNAFLDFVFSEKGAAILEKYGSYPIR
ncbi:MAG: phosphate ABC transporter substrate-binding protein [Gammaproteobacteria bacterium]|nr:MAG: phosphate ABC transporter substrate-binding protein [Pseudomonadota bacterium]PIE38058.1 MAG: phosphate ABC transporter substrate-binding protein [Gammaproteobacteria bacterium]